MRIAEVARKSGFSPATLRYYDDIGLLPAASRTAAGYRQYDERSVERLAFIARAKQLGCSLDEIVSLMAAWDTDCDGVRGRLRDLVADKIAAAMRQTAELSALTAQLERAAAQLHAGPADGPCGADCACAVDVAAGEAAAAAPQADSDVACTLSPGDMPGRVEAWAALTARALARTDVTGGVRLQFGNDTPVADIVRLAAAEQSCCSFFSFAVTMDCRGVGLEVRAPEAVRELVSALFGYADAADRPAS